MVFGLTFFRRRPRARRNLLLQLLLFCRLGCRVPRGRLDLGLQADDPKLTESAGLVGLIVAALLELIEVQLPTADRKALVGGDGHRVPALDGPDLITPVLDGLFLVEFDLLLGGRGGNGQHGGRKQQQEEGFRIIDMGGSSRGDVPWGQGK